MSSDILWIYVLEEKLLVKNSLSLSEKSYSEEKRKLLKNTSPEQISKNPFVYMDRQLVSTVLTRIKIFENLSISKFIFDIKKLKL